MSTGKLIIRNANRITWILAGLLVAIGIISWIVLGTYGSQVSDLTRGMSGLASMFGGGSSASSTDLGLGGYGFGIFAVCFVLAYVCRLCYPLLVGFGELVERNAQAKQTGAAEPISGGPVPPKKRFCANCGTELSESAEFCPECGHKAK